LPKFWAEFVRALPLGKTLAENQKYFSEENFLRSTAERINNGMPESLFFSASTAEN